MAFLASYLGRCKPSRAKGETMAAIGESVEVTPFQIEIADEILADLNARLVRTRLPDEVEGGGWDYGTSVAYVRELCHYWSTSFDWRARERSLNELPHFRALVDGLGVHFVHVRGNGPCPFPLVLTHGWPSSFFELVKLIPFLTDPSAHGADAADAFDVVIPSIPGYGFSDIPSTRYASARVPYMWEKLMRGLGYHRFGAHGGDIGGGITARLGQLFPASTVAGVHTTNVYGSIDDGDRPPSEAEKAYLERRERWERDEWAYGQMQGTRPQTLAVGLNDSPAGLAAWIVEKYRAWSDCDGDVESVFSKDELLTNITIYWATSTIASSFRPYWDFRHNPDALPWMPVEVPCGIAIFPKDIATPPREFAERTYNVQHWTEMPRGGHFPGLEQPQLLAEDIRTFFRQVR
jgi:pimeloyl-ACP methyl ester carboxylesterase